MSVAIIEDNDAIREEIASHVKRWADENGVSVTVSVYSGGAAFLQDYKHVSAVFLDIMMPGIDGIRVAEKLREKDERVVLVFLTSMPQYAIKAYEFGALDYILKPLSYDRFVAKMNRIYATLRADSEKNITIPLTDGVYVTSTKDIIYIEVTGHRIIYKLVGGRALDSHGSISKLEKQLADIGFLRCNNCYLVNVDHIEYVRGLTVHIGGEELAISRPRRKAFIAGITAALGNGIRQ